MGLVGCTDDSTTHHLDILSIGTLGYLLGMREINTEIVRNFAKDMDMMPTEEALLIALIALNQTYQDREKRGLEKPQEVLDGMMQQARQEAFDEALALVGKEINDMPWSRNDDGVTEIETNTYYIKV